MLTRTRDIKNAREREQMCVGESAKEKKCEERERDIQKRKRVKRERECENKWSKTGDCGPASKMCKWS